MTEQTDAFSPYLRYEVKETLIPVIEVKNLSKSFGAHKVLENVNLKVFKGESFVVIGGSGTGKSVLIKCILGLIEPDKGEILIDGYDIYDMDYKERRDCLKSFGMLFQGGALFDSLTIAENVAFGLEQGFHMNPTEARKIAIEKLRAVELPEKIADAYPAELSGGMQKRAALARTIATNPRVIFFDEPTTGLDPILSGTINALIRQSIQDLKACTVTITHDMQSLRTIGHRVGLLYQGSFIWQGKVSEMDTTDNPYVRQFVSGNPNGPFTIQGSDRAH